MRYIRCTDQMQVEEELLESVAAAARLVPEVARLSHLRGRVLGPHLLIDMQVGCHPERLLIAHCAARQHALPYHALLATHCSLPPSPPPPPPHSSPRHSSHPSFGRPRGVTQLRTLHYVTCVTYGASVHTVHALRLLQVSVDPSMSASVAQQVATKVRLQVVSQVPQVTEVLVHFDTALVAADELELRRGAPTVAAAAGEEGEGGMRQVPLVLHECSRPEAEVATAAAESETPKVRRCTRLRRTRLRRTRLRRTRLRCTRLRCTALLHCSCRPAAPLAALVTCLPSAPAHSALPPLPGWQVMRPQVEIEREVRQALAALPEVWGCSHIHLLWDSTRGGALVQVCHAVTSVTSVTSLVQVEPRQHVCCQHMLPSRVRRCVCAVACASSLVRQQLEWSTPERTGAHRSLRVGHTPPSCL